MSRKGFLLHRASTCLRLAKFVWAILLLLWSGASAEEPTIRVTFLFSFGRFGEENGCFNQPGGLSVDPAGNVYVADTGNHRLQKFTGNGAWLAAIGGFGWDAEQFNRPLDVVSPNGLDVFVADYENNRIERYDRDLNWILTIRTDETIEQGKRFALPRSLAVSLHSNLFIVDNENRRVLKMNSQYIPTTIFADFNWGDGELLRPGQCALDRSDRLYVCDELSRKIMIYDYFGNFLDFIDHPELGVPSGIALWRDEVIVVGNRTTDRLIFLSPEGKIFGQFGGSGAKFGAFRHISDLAVTGNRLYVSDMENHRIQVFKLDYDRP